MWQQVYVEMRTGLFKVTKKFLPNMPYYFLTILACCTYLRDYDKG